MRLQGKITRWDDERGFGFIFSDGDTRIDITSNGADWWLGALAARRLLRHKSRKIEFLFIFGVTVFLKVAAIGSIYY